MKAEKLFKFVIVETATYHISATGKTVEEAARAAGPKFGADPQKCFDGVDERTVTVDDAEATVVTAEFDAGMGGD